MELSCACQIHDKDSDIVGQVGPKLEHGQEGDKAP